MAPLANTVAVLSAPRLAFTDHMFCFVRGLVPLGIPVDKHSGAFWSQSITRCFDKHLDDGTEFIVTLDYDSWFCADDVRELHRLISADHRIHAVCPLQAKRGGDGVLGGVCVDGEMRCIKPEDLTADISQITTGHFGLTILRVSALRRTPRPWFHGQPDASGGWGKGKIDDDIWFWHQWKAAGNTVFVAPHVAIGHIQAMVSWPGADLKPFHQYINRCEDAGKPEGCYGRRA